MASEHVSIVRAEVIVLLVYPLGDLMFGSSINQLSGFVGCEWQDVEATRKNTSLNRLLAGLSGLWKGQSPDRGPGPCSSVPSRGWDRRILGAQVEDFIHFKPRHLFCSERGGFGFLKLITATRIRRFRRSKHLRFAGNNLGKLQKLKAQMTQFSALINLFKGSSPETKGPAASISEMLNPIRTAFAIVSTSGTCL